MTLTLPKDPRKPDPEKHPTVNLRTLDDLAQFVQNCHTYGLPNDTIIVVSDPNGNTHGITGFLVSRASIKIGFN
jgi:hypothetical protein